MKSNALAAALLLLLPLLSSCYLFKTYPPPDLNEKTIFSYRGHAAKPIANLFVTGGDCTAGSKTPAAEDLCIQTTAANYDRLLTLLLKSRNVTLNLPKDEDYIEITAGTGAPRYLGKRNFNDFSREWSYFFANDPALANAQRYWN